MQSLEVNNFSYRVVRDALHGRSGTRNVKFTYNLLDKNDLLKKELSNVLSCTIDCDSTASIQRTAKFTMTPDPDINFLSDRVQPMFHIQIGGKWASWSLGIFILASPQEDDSNTTGVKIYSIDAYDKNQILRSISFDRRYFIRRETTYSDAISQLLLYCGIDKYNITPTTEVIQVDREYEEGANVLDTINELLREVNYTNIKVDEQGTFIAEPYVPQSERVPDYEYDSGDLSVIYKGVKNKIDNFNTPNKWVVIMSNPEVAPIKVTAVNNDPNSPLSIVNRGRTITKVQKVDNISSISKLNSYLKQVVDSSTDGVQEVEFETALMPMHSIEDTLVLKYPQIGIEGKFIEEGWSMNLKAGAKMLHRVRSAKNYDIYDGNIFVREG